MATERRFPPPGPGLDEEAPSHAPSKDTMTQLGDALATLERLLDQQGVPPDPPVRQGPRDESELSPDPALTHEPADSIPLLNDVVTPMDRPQGEPDPAPEPLLRAVPPLEAMPGPILAHEDGGDEDWIDFRLTPSEPIESVEDLPEGRGFPHARGREAALEDRYFDAPVPVLEPEQYRHLVNRLANEIDVLVQAGVEEIVRAAAADIADKVRKHVAIVLPEIIEELAQMSHRRRE